jgi:hypothetical protein
MSNRSFRALIARVAQSPWTQQIGGGVIAGVAVLLVQHFLFGG